MTLPERSECPNPKGVTAEFAQEQIETRAWRLKGVGMFGSDVDVIALEEYRELAAAYHALLQTLMRWSASATAYETALVAIAADTVPEEITLSAYAQQALDERKARL